MVSMFDILYTEWRTKCHTIDCAHNTFLLLQKHMRPGTELILIGWKIVPNEEHVQCDHRFASQPLAHEPLHSNVFVIIKICYVHNQWYDISCTTLYVDWF